ncbi:uncharacterized protein LOC143301089 isoform X2 [Babylonia areolata]|uniref:uncharacterized protein LOC143301089 isoform X2 n=1 Tax=Babylonia areolata TaxID=304850 RepID=UPI003FD3DC0D
MALHPGRLLILFHVVFTLTNQRENDGNEEDCTPRDLSCLKPVNFKLGPSKCGPRELVIDKLQFNTSCVKQGEIHCLEFDYRHEEGNTKSRSMFQEFFWYLGKKIKQFFELAKDSDMNDGWMTTHVPVIFCGHVQVSIDFDSSMTVRNIRYKETSCGTNDNLTPDEDPCEQIASVTSTTPVTSFVTTHVPVTSEKTSERPTPTGKRNATGTSKTPVTSFVTTHVPVTSEKTSERPTPTVDAEERTDEEEKKDEEGLSTSVVVALSVCGGVVAVGLLMLGAVWCWRRRFRKNNHPPHPMMAMSDNMGQQQQQQQQQHGAGDNRQVQPGSSCPADPDYQHLHLDRSAASLGPAGIVSGTGEDIYNHTTSPSTVTSPAASQWEVDNTYTEVDAQPIRAPKMTSPAASRWEAENTYPEVDENRAAPPSGDIYHVLEATPDRKDTTPGAEDKGDYHHLELGGRKEEAGGGGGGKVYDGLQWVGGDTYSHVQRGGRTEEVGDGLYSHI